MALNQGAIQFEGAAGNTLLIEAPWVVDAAGTRSDQAVRWELGQPDAAGTRRLTLVLDPAGLTYPLAIDPSFWIAPGGHPSNMFTRRMEHTATLLNNGLVLVAGGRVATVDGIIGDATATAEVYNPANGTWANTGSMARARLNHTATLLPNGKVLVVGGFNGSDNQLTAAEVYNPDTGTWSSAGNTRLSRERHTATLLQQNGGGVSLVLVAGGRTGISTASLREAELYNPNTNAWVDTGSMASAREKHTATLLPDGRVLVTGGLAGIDGTGTTLASAEIYNPGNGQWAGTGSMPGERQRHSATLVISDKAANTYKVLVLGGCNGAKAATAPCTHALDTSAVYDVAGGGWTAGPTLPEVTYSARGCTLPCGSNNPPPPPTGARYDHTATLLPSGLVLMALGRDGLDDNNPPANPPANTWQPASLAVNSAAIFDPTAGPTGSWTGWVEDDLVNDGATTSARYAHTATLLPSGLVMIAGGFNKGGYGNPVPGSDALHPNTNLYDPSEGIFANSASTLPVSGRRDHTATLLPNGKVLVAGGSSSDTNALNSAAVYDPNTDAWTPTGNLNTARFGHSATLMPTGKVLVVGGQGCLDQPPQRRTR